MANYCAFTRSNYFRVTNPERMREIVSQAIADEDTLSLFEEHTESETLFGFGCYGSILGLPMPEASEEDDDEEYSFDGFLSALQEILAPGDAIIVTEVGYEKLRYLVGVSTIVTADTISSVQLNEAAIAAARRQLGNPNWITIMEY